MVHFILEMDKEKRIPSFPFLCLLVSGGHTRIIIMRNHYEMDVIGNTIDDAAGEAFDKCGKVMGFPYPAGPLIDKLAKEGNSTAYTFSKPAVKGLDFSFSGLKTGFLYFLRDQIRVDPGFVENNKADLCASLQATITDILIGKMIKASHDTGITEIGIAGGVSANSGLRDGMMIEAQKRKWNLFIPEFRYTTDNAAMIGITGYYKYLRGEFAGHEVTPLARY
jgi:N6-L-threonylcarbamoyladenine synthase